MDTTDNRKSDKTKQVLHFSDGILEIGDDDEEDNDLDNSNIDSDKQIMKDWPKVGVVINSMSWLGSKTLKVCDYLGENLADFFGITSPKYEYEIQEYNRRIEEQNRRESKIKEEFEGWTQLDGTDKEIKLSDVKSVINSKDTNSCIEPKFKAEPKNQYFSTEPKV